VTSRGEGRKRKTLSSDIAVGMWIAHSLAVLAETGAQKGFAPSLSTQYHADKH